MLWRVAQILCQNWVIFLARGGMGWVRSFSWVLLQALSSAKLTITPPCRNSLDLSTASSSSIRAWPVGLKVGQLLKVHACSMTPPGVAGALFFNSLRFNFLLPNLAFFHPPCFLSTSPINLPHTTLRWMFPWTWPITLLLPILLQKCSYFVRFLLSSVSSHCLNSPISAIFNVCFWKQSHMYWLLEVLLERGKSLFL